MEHTVFHPYEPFLWIAGMLTHLLVRFLEWRFKPEHQGESARIYFATFFSKAVVSSNVLSLALLAFWSSDYLLKIPGISAFKPSDYLPHGLLMSFVLGYFGTSIIRHAIFFLRDRGVLKKIGNGAVNGNGV